MQDNFPVISSPKQTVLLSALISRLQNLFSPGRYFTSKKNKAFSLGDVLLLLVVLSFQNTEITLAGFKTMIRIPSFDFSKISS